MMHFHKMISANVIIKRKKEIYAIVKHFCRHRHHHRVSRLFQPLNVIPKDAVTKKDEQVSISQKLMIDCGIVRARGNGMFAFLPLGQRALSKLSTLIDEGMRNLGAQKILLPTLTDGHLWKKTGRWETTGDELMRVKDRHEKDYVISPTHEEAIVDMLAEVYPLSYRIFPLRLYQISSKFRDEANPRFGLLRCKEFLMKDLYSFDKDEASAMATYNQVCQIYDNIFQRLQVPFIKVAGDCGNIGGSFSHEYHYQTAVGQDTLLICDGCGTAMNSELTEDCKNMTCSSCGDNMKESKGIEVGHTFLLGTKYSKALNGSYQNEKGKPSLLQMGCYGIGVSRLLAASLEVLSSENGIRWPWLIAPFKVCIIGPKRGSKEENLNSWVDFLAKAIDGLPEFCDDVIIDDRNTLTIGKRMMEAKKIGYPIIIVVGKKAGDAIPKFEIIDNATSNVYLYTQSQLLDFIRNKIIT